MGDQKSTARRQVEFSAAAAAMYVRLRQWRAAHPEASFDQIGEQVTGERKQLMALLLGELAAQPEEVTGVEVAQCRECGKELTAKGQRGRGVAHLEGEVRLEREYHYCDHCQRGLFPPGRQIEVNETRLESCDD